MTPFDITTSKVLSPYGIVSESIFIISKFMTPPEARFSLARSAICSVKSTPHNLLPLPANLEATNRSNPAPQPKSRTASPGEILPRENGLPTPQKDSRILAGAAVDYIRIISKGLSALSAGRIGKLSLS